MNIAQATALRASRDPEYLAEVLMALLNDQQRTRDLALATQQAIDDLLATLEVATTNDAGYGEDCHDHALSGSTQLRLRSIRRALESHTRTEVAA